MRMLLLTVQMLNLSMLMGIILSMWHIIPVQPPYILAWFIGARMVCCWGIQLLGNMGLLAGWMSLRLSWVKAALYMTLQRQSCATPRKRGRLKMPLISSLWLRSIIWMVYTPLLILKILRMIHFCWMLEKRQRCVNRLSNMPLIYLSHNCEIDLRNCLKIVKYSYFAKAGFAGILPRPFLINAVSVPGISVEGILL